MPAGSSGAGRLEPVTASCFSLFRGICFPSEYLVFFPAQQGVWPLARYTVNSDEREREKYVQRSGKDSRRFPSGSLLLCLFHTLQTPLAARPGRPSRGLQPVRCCSGSNPILCCSAGVRDDASILPLQRRAINFTVGL